MKKISIILILIVATVLWGISYKQGSGISTGQIERGTEASYHTGSSDRDFYYTYPEAEAHRWAVKFNFNEYYDNIDSLKFAPETVKIYLPNSTEIGDLTVGLYGDGDLGPGEQITEGSLVNSSLVEGWNEISVSLAPDTLFWLVVDYQTGFVTEQYISSSNGDGTHSYYWDPYYGEGSWRNMSANGFNNEFLFSLEGEFMFSEPDLAISEFNLEGDFVAGSQIFARAVLRNNYTEPLDSIYVEFKKEFPGDIERDTIFVSSIEAGVSLELPENDYKTYLLSSTPGQYQFKVSVLNNGITANNSQDLIRNTFGIEQERILVENMVELNDSYSDGIWQDQSSISDVDLLSINYFPYYQDSEYYNILAEERFHYYNLYSLPATVAAGEVFQGYQQEYYQEEFHDFCSGYISEKTFLEFSSITAQIDTLQDVSVSIELDRKDNQVLSSYMANCKLYGMIYETDLPLNDLHSGNVFLDTLSFSSPSIDGLVNVDTLVLSTTFNKIYDVNPLVDSLNCHLLFWIQNDEDNKIWAVDEISFTDFSLRPDSSEENIPVARYFAYPNPCFSVDEIRISTPERVDVSEMQVNIFNVKGQLIKQLSSGTTSWDKTDMHDHAVASGIYFFQVKQKSYPSEWLKVMVIK